MLTHEILQSFEVVKPAGSNQWTADCPNIAHRTAKVSIKDTGDRTLVRCWGGCDTSAVIGAIGLTFVDLYHTELSDDERIEKRKYHSQEKLKHEATIVWIAYSDKRRGKLKPADAIRANQAYKTLREASWL